MHDLLAEGPTRSGLPNTDYSPTVSTNSLWRCGRAALSQNLWIGVPFRRCRLVLAVDGDRRRLASEQARRRENHSKCG
jgi:hypothetical protein